MFFLSWYDDIKIMVQWEKIMFLPRLIQWPAKANWNELKEKYRTAGGVLIGGYDDVDDGDNDDDDDLYDKDNDDACRWWVWDKMRRKRNSGKRRREWQVHIFAHIFCIFVHIFIFLSFLYIFCIQSEGNVDRCKWMEEKRNTL